MEDKEEIWFCRNGNWMESARVEDKYQVVQNCAVEQSRWWRPTALQTEQEEQEEQDEEEARAKSRNQKKKKGFDRKSSQQTAPLVRMHTMSLENDDDSSLH